MRTLRLESLATVLNHRVHHPLRIPDAAAAAPAFHRRTGQQRRPTAVRPAAASKVEDPDEKQERDIKRLINIVHELQDQVKKLDAENAQAERRDRDRMIAIRKIIKEEILKTAANPAAALASIDGGGALASRLEEVVDREMNPAEAEANWDSYRNSFTLLMSKGYLQTMEQLRDELLSSEWEIGLRPIALQVGVSRFEAYCAAQSAAISYETLTQLYDDPTDLGVIEDAHLRMQARSAIAAAEYEQRLICFHACTDEAKKLAQQFSEGEFISKLLPDPIEHGVVDSLRKVAQSASTFTKFMGRGNA